MPFYLFALGRDIGETFFLVVSRITKVAAVDGPVVSLGRLRGNPMILDRGEAVRTREAVDVKGTHHVSNVCEVKIPPLTAGRRDPFLLGRRSLKNDVLVPLVGYWLTHDLETFAIVVHAVDKIVGIITALHLGVVHLFIYALLGCFVRLLYLSSIAVHAACSLPLHPPGSCPWAF